SGVPAGTCVVMVTRCSMARALLSAAKAAVVADNTWLTANVSRACSTRCEAIVFAPSTTAWSPPARLRYHPPGSGGGDGGARRPPGGFGFAHGGGGFSAEPQFHRDSSPVGGGVEPSEDRGKPEGDPLHDHERSGDRRVVLDLAELALLEHVSAHRVRRPRRCERDLAVLGQVVS